MYTSNLNAVTTLTGNYTITFTIEDTTSTKLSIFLKINEDDFVEILTNQTFGDIEITGERLKKGINQGIIKIVDNTIPTPDVESEGEIIPPFDEEIFVPESYITIPFYLNVKETPAISNIETVSTDSLGNYEISFSLTGDKSFTHIISMKIDDEVEYKEIIIGQPLGLIKYIGADLSLGEHILHLRVSDGYDEFLVDYTIEIKNNIPFVSNILVSNESSTGDFTLTYTTKDVETPTLTHKLKIDDGDFNEITVSKDNHCYTYTGTTTVGTHTCYIQVSDGITTIDSNPFEITIFASTTSVKEKLRQAKVYCDLRYNDYKKTIDTVVGDGIFNYDLENPLIVKSKDNYILAHSEFTKIHQQALDFISGKKVNDAKVDLNKEIQDVNDAINGLVIDMNGAFADGLLNEAEKKVLKQSLANLETQKGNIDNQFNKLYANAKLTVVTKSSFQTSYNTFVSKYNVLINLMNASMSKDELITESETNAIDMAYDELNEALASYTTVVNQVIEEIANKESQAVKDELSQDISDVDNRITNLNNTMIGSFADGLIDEAERKVLKQNLQIIANEKSDIDNQYEQLYNSVNLKDVTLKTTYFTSYGDYTLDYNAYLTVVTNVINKTDLITDADRANIENASADLVASLGYFVKTSNQVIEEIAKNQAQSVNDQIKTDLDNLSNKVDNIIDDAGGAISDGIIDEAERISIKQNLKSLENQRTNLYNQYIDIYNNILLTGTPKTELYTAYTEYNTSYNSLVSTINTIINKIGTVGEEDRTALDMAYNTYNTRLATFSTKLSTALNFITNKGIENAKEELNGEIGDLNDALTSLDSTMNGVFKDGVISDSEKIAIRQNLNLLANEKSDIDNHYTNVYGNTSLIGVPKTNLKTKYDAYISKYNSLLATINEIVDKTTNVLPSDKINLDNSFNQHKTALGEFISAYNTALDSITNKDINDAKDELNENINGVSEALAGLEVTMNGIFKDGILSEAEKSAIRQSLQLVTKEKIDIDNDYTSLYNNVDLINPSKTNLKTAYDNFILKHNVLVVTIENILSKTDIVDNNDKTALDTAFSEWKKSLGSYTIASNNAIDAIASKKASDEAGKIDKKWAEIILNPETGLQTHVGKIETTMQQNYENLKGDIDGVQIGGTNLWRNTSLRDNADYFVLNPGTTRCTDKHTPNGNYCFKHTQSGNEDVVNNGAYQYSTHVHIGEEYTFSCQALIESLHGIDDGFKMSLLCCREDNSIITSNIHDFDVNIMNKWQKGVITCTIPKETVYIVARTYIVKNGTAYDGDWMIEEGNKNSTWSPSPIDIDTLITKTKTDINEVINNNTTSNNAIWEETLKNALANYMQTGKYDEILEIVDSKILQSATSIDVVFNAFKGQIENTVDGIIGTTDELQSYIRFDIDGMELGKTNSPFTLKVTNEKIQFLENGNEVAYISNNAMVITDAYVKNSLRVGGMQWISRDDGRLDFIWKGLE